MERLDREAEKIQELGVCNMLTRPVMIITNIANYELFVIILWIRRGILDYF